MGKLRILGFVWLMIGLIDTPELFSVVEKGVVDRGIGQYSREPDDEPFPDDRSFSFFDIVVLLSGNAESGDVDSADVDVAQSLTPEEIVNVHQKQKSSDRGSWRAPKGNGEVMEPKRVPRQNNNASAPSVVSARISRLTNPNRSNDSKLSNPSNPSNGQVVTGVSSTRKFSKKYGNVD